MNSDGMMRQAIKLLAGTCVAALGLLPALAPSPALAQFSEPLEPVPTLPEGPVVPFVPQGGFLQQGMSVTERPRPEVDPTGVRFGDFFFFPRGEVDEAYNDNIFATTNNPTGAFITVLQPGFDIRSNLPQNALNISAGGAFFRYDSHTNLNSDNGYGDVNGKLDVDNTHYFTGDVRAERSHIDIGAPEVPGNAAAPLTFTDYNATMGFSQYRLRIGYDLTATVRREDYDAIPLVGGSSTPESQLDNWSYQATVRPYYEFQPGYQAYFRGSYNKRDYDHAQGNGVPTLSSNGYRVDVGARINLTGVTYLDGFVGYLAQDYQASSFGTIGGVDFGANLVWNATQLTSVSFKTGRTVEDINEAVLTGVAVANSPGYLETTAAVNVDHELLRNLLLNGNIGYTNDEFQNITRSDNYYSAGAGVKYLMMRNLYLGGTYTFERVRSNGTAEMAPYDRNIIMLRLSTQL
ncbi:MAG TPA: outer membrane beta-barrel protein [Stellaceae bacterium]|nr:outer membrane beta-barrel protein [Stellaceae bacterium]